MISRMAAVIGIPRVNTRWEVREFGRVISVHATWTLDDEIAAGLYTARRKIGSPRRKNRWA